MCLVRLLFGQLVCMHAGQSAQPSLWASHQAAGPSSWTGAQGTDGGGGVCVCERGLQQDCEHQAGKLSWKAWKVKWATKGYGKKVRIAHRKAEVQENLQEAIALILVLHVEPFLVLFPSSYFEKPLFLLQVSRPQFSKALQHWLT